jgi:hypothetical protein
MEHMEHVILVVGAMSPYRIADIIRGFETEHPHITIIPTQTIELARELAVAYPGVKLGTIVYSNEYPNDMRELLEPFAKEMHESIKPLAKEVVPYICNQIPEYIERFEQPKYKSWERPYKYHR